MGTVSGKRSTVKRKRYSRKFQRMAVERMRTCENVVELARELEVRPRCLYKWRAKLEALEPGEESARPSTHAATYRKPPDRLSHFEVDLPASNSGRDLPSPAFAAHLFPYILRPGVTELLLPLWLVVIGVNVERRKEQASAAGVST
jgi:hypothetical protein